LGEAAGGWGVAAFQPLREGSPGSGSDSDGKSFTLMDRGRTSSRSWESAVLVETRV
jgi:hypothetical protein